MRSVSKQKEIDRLALAQHTAEFLARGNKIREVAPEASSDVPVNLKERSEYDRKIKLAIDKARLKELHANDKFLNIRFLPKCKTKDARFRLSHEAKVLGYFPTLTEAMSFVIKA